MPFDKNNDSIAITVPRFVLRKSSDGPWGTTHLYRNEPYILTFAVDSNGLGTTKIDFNKASFPNVREGDEVNMIGDGHLVYGPANPGEWVAVSVLVMESDEGIRRAGKTLEEIVQNASLDAGLRALLTANATAAAIGRGLLSVGEIVARILQLNTDDQLFLTHGVFLRDKPVPYDVNRLFRRRNEYIELDLKVVNLQSPNGQGPVPSPLSL